MTHSELVKRATQWLKNTLRCSLVMSEMTTLNSETPDVFGFQSGAGRSILVECKASRSDFNRDKEKLFRRFGELGMGTLRYYFCPADLLKPDDMPDGWGLIYVAGRCKIVKEARAFPISEARYKAEMTMLVSSIRRIKIASLVVVEREVLNNDEWPEPVVEVS